MLRDLTVFTSRLSLDWPVCRSIECPHPCLLRQRPANPIAGATNVDRRFAASGCAIGYGDIALELLDLMLLNQADGAAAETGTSQPRAIASWYMLRRRDQRIHLGNADLVIVAQAN